MIETILIIPFLLSSINNGATVSYGIGMVESETLFISPVGQIEVYTDIYRNNNLSISMGASHASSIPDASDNYDSTDLNMMTIKLSVKIGGIR